MSTHMRSFSNRLLKICSRSNIFRISSIITASAFVTTSGLEQDNDNRTWKRFENNTDHKKRIELLEQKRDCKSSKTMESMHEFQTYLDPLHNDWEVKIDNGKFHLIREFNVDTYGEVMDICSGVMKCAENFRYHPDMQTSHKQVVIDIFSFKFNGLREIDFIFAAKIDQVINELSEKYIEDYTDDIVDWSTRELTEQFFENFAETFRDTVKSGDTFDELLKYYADDVFDCNPKKCYDNKADLLKDLNNGFKLYKSFDPYFDILVWSKKQCIVRNTYVRKGINDKLNTFRGTILIKLNDTGKISHWIYTADQKMLDDLKAFTQELVQYK